jgi:hypothetical protein
MKTARVKLGMNVHRERQLKPNLKDDEDKGEIQSSSLRINSRQPEMQPKAQRYSSLPREKVSCPDWK